MLLQELAMQQYRVLTLAVPLPEIFAMLLPVTAVYSTDFGYAAHNAVLTLLMRLPGSEY